jgi:hypothetical protein
VLGVLLITFLIVVTPVVAGQNILARSGPIHLRSAPLSVAIPLDVDSWVMQSAADRDQLALYLQGVVFNGPPGTYYEIYVDLPAEVKNPDPGSANFVGRLTPNSQRELGSAIDSGNHIPYSIAGVVRALTQARTWNPETLTITFVPRGVVAAERGQPVRMSTVRARIGGLLIVSG